MTLSPLETVLERFDAQPAGKNKYGRDQWKARCPAHDDNHESLSIAQGEKVPVILECFAGCETPAIVAAVGLTIADLMPPKDRASGGKWKKIYSTQKILACYDYTDAGGNLLYQTLRISYDEQNEASGDIRHVPKDFSQRRPDGKGGWIWNLSGVSLVLFRLPDVLKAVSEGKAVFLVEGERDAHLPLATHFLHLELPSGWISNNHLLFASELDLFLQFAMIRRLVLDEFEMVHKFNPDIQRKYEVPGHHGFFYGVPEVDFKASEAGINISAESLAKVAAIHSDLTAVTAEHCRRKIAFVPVVYDNVHEGIVRRLLSVDKGDERLNRLSEAYKDAFDPIQLVWMDDGLMTDVRKTGRPFHGHAKAIFEILETFFIAVREKRLKLCAECEMGFIEHKQKKEQLYCSHRCADRVSHRKARLSLSD